MLINKEDKGSISSKFNNNLLVIEGGKMEEDFKLRAYDDEEDWDEDDEDDDDDNEDDEE